MKKSVILSGSALAVLLVLAAFTGCAAAAPLVGGGALTVYLETSPSGATATYEATGETINTPGYFTTIHEGTRYWGVPTTIRISKSGYYTDYINVLSSDFEAGRSNTLRLSDSLSPTSRTGYLSVSSSPSGASIFINGVYYGDTPASLSLSEGTYDLQLKRSGYSPYITTVSVLADRTSFVTASMSPDVQLGYISVHATPAGASLYVDGSYVGSAPSVTGLTAGPFTTGTTHTLTGSAAGYQSASTTFYLNAGETKDVTLNLIPEQAQKGSIYITSNPSNAALYVDNLYYGMTPARVSELTPGSHVIKLSAQNYNDWQETVTVSAGQTLEKSVSLSPASPTPAPTAPPKTPLPLAGILVGLGAAAVLLLRRK